MKYNQIRSLVEYIYYGEAAVPEDELQGSYSFIMAWFQGS